MATCNLSKSEIIARIIEARDIELELYAEAQCRDVSETIRARRFGRYAAIADLLRDLGIDE